MAPIALDTTQPQSNNPVAQDDVAALKARLQALHTDAANDTLGTGDEGLNGKPRARADALVLPPDNTLRRYLKAGIDLSGGYPYFPPKPEFVQDVAKIRTDLREYVDPGTRADKDKKALFGAAKEVRNLTTHIGVSDWLQLLDCVIQSEAEGLQTEIVGLQLKDLSDQQKDELALLVAERSVVCRSLLLLAAKSATWSRLTPADLQSSATKTSRLNSSRPSACTWETARSSGTRRPPKCPAWAAASL